MSIRRGMLFTLGAKIKNLVQAFKERVLATQGEFEAEGCLEAQLTQLDNQNLLDNASLIVTPNGYKETLLYAVEPNEVGTNLFLRSQEFDNAAWIKQGGSETIILPNVETAPNGTLTGDKMYPNTSGPVRGVFQINFPINTYRHSVYAKKGGKNFLYLYVIGSTANTGCWFNLDTGTIGTVGSSWSNATIENVGNGWYRCSATVSITNSTNFIYYFVSDTNNNVNVTANGTDGIFLWGAQLVPGSTITDYISTTDRAIINGTIGDMSVTRATRATRVNSEGLIEVVPYNIFLRSEEFDNATWNKTSVLSIIQNTITAPNGTLTADTIRLGIAASPTRYRLFQLQFYQTGITYTTSYYLKKANNRWIQLVYVNDTVFGVSNWANFDLENGVIGNTGPGAIATITDVGNGWYRCSVQAIAIASGTTSGCEIVTTNNTNSGRYPSYQSTIAEDVCYVWGAQLVNGSLAKDYFPTTNGFNVPRIDYSNGSCPSILVEPQRTNLVLRSEEFENASWIKTNTTITSNTTISPSGIQNADTYNVVSTTANFIYQNITLTTGAYGISVYAKKGTSNIIRLFNVASGTSAAWFDLDLGQVIGTVNGGTASIENVGNGWYRCIYRGTSIISGFTGIGLSDTANSVTASISSSVYLWGAQLEAGTNATSYIPTVASTVTRNADVITNTNASTLIGQTEGTIFIEVDLRNIFIRDGLLVVIRNQANPINRLQIYFTTTGNINNNIAFNHVVNGVFNNVNSNTISPLGISKIAVTYKNGNPTIMSINGVNYQTVGNVGAFTASINQFVLGSFGDTGAAPLNDSIKISYLLPSYLTVNQLNTLTTL